MQAAGRASSRAHPQHLTTPPTRMSPTFRTTRRPATATMPLAGGGGVVVAAAAAGAQRMTVR